MGIFSAMRGLFCSKQEYTVYGEQGGISTKITLPKGFDIKSDRCPMVILMHGFMSNKGIYPIPNLAKALAELGIASIGFDFNAHGRSEGQFVDMTIANEIADAKAVLEYVKGLDYVTEVGFVGHSQGGVIAGMLAGELESSPFKPKCVALLAPAAVLKDDALAGQCMGSRYDASNPPEYVNVMFHRLGRKFILAAQKLPIYETSCQYTGKVCIVQGKRDKIVPYTYGERYHKGYKDSVLHLLDEEGHFLRKNKQQVIDLATNFMRENLK